MYPDIAILGSWAASGVAYLPMRGCMLRGHVVALHALAVGWDEPVHVRQDPAGTGYNPATKSKRWRNAVCDME